MSLFLDDDSELITAHNINAPFNMKKGQGVVRVTEIGMVKCKIEVRKQSIYLQLVL